MNLLSKESLMVEPNHAQSINAERDRLLRALMDRYCHYLMALSRADLIRMHEKKAYTLVEAHLDRT